VGWAGANNQLSFKIATDTNANPAAEIQLRINDDGDLYLSMETTGPDLGTVKTFTGYGGNITDLDLAVKFNNDDNTYQGFWRESGGTWQSSSVGTANAGVDIEQLALEMFAIEATVIDRLYFTDVNPIPEPATIGLLGVGGLLALVRKTRNK
jgi:hypothetical protein